MAFTGALIEEDTRADLQPREESTLRKKIVEGGRDSEKKVL